MMNSCRFIVIAALLTTALAPGALATIIQLSPTDDTFIRNSEPNTVQGAYDFLAVFDYQTTFYGLDYTVLKFNLSAIPDSASFNSATLYLWSNNFADDQDVVHLTNDAWTEGTLTWNNFAPGTETLLGSRQSAWEQYIGWSLNLTAWSYATDLADNSVTLMVKFQPGGGMYLSNWFRSKEYMISSQHPYLEIDYEEGGPVIPEPASAVLVVLGGCLVFTGRAVRRRLLR
jgi:hypothetical protein